MATSIRSPSAGAAVAGERLDLAERAAPDGHERVEVGADRADPQPGHELHEIDPVRADVGDRPERSADARAPAASSSRCRAAASPAGSRRVTRFGRPIVAAGHQRAGLVVVGVVAEVEAHGVDESRRGRPGEQLGALAGCRRPGASRRRRACRRRGPGAPGRRGGGSAW